MTTSTTVPDFGTLAWAHAGGGRMTRREKLAELARSASVIAPLMTARAATGLRLPQRSMVSLNIDGVTFPDSAVARDAEAECREHASEMMYNHSVRCYVWALMLAEHRGLKPDLEMLYVASLLHDLTLEDDYRDYAPMACFAARGAILANDWAAERGWGRDQRTVLADAVSLHLNSRVHPKHGPEAELLQAAAGVETIGLHYRRLDPESVARVLDRYPYLDMGRVGLPRFVGESHPHTRARFLMRIGFGTLVRTSPLAK